MANVKITGHSDDCIELEGDIYEEFNHAGWSDKTDKSIIFFSEGTSFSIEYDEDGIWRFTPLSQHKDTIVGISKALVGNNDCYSDEVNIKGDIKWCIFANNYQLVKAKKSN